MFGASVKGGTGAGSKRRRDPNVTRCVDCRGFVSQTRAAQGHDVCVRCETVRSR